MRFLHALTLSVAFVANVAAQQSARGWLGVYLADVDRVELVEVVPGSPAAIAGLRIGDVVCSFHGAETANVDAFVAAISARTVGDLVELEIDRTGEAISFLVRLVKRPEASRPATPKPSGSSSPRRPPAPAGETLRFEAVRTMDWRALSLRTRERRLESESVQLHVEVRRLR